MSQREEATKWIEDARRSEATYRARELTRLLSVEDKAKGCRHMVGVRRGVGCSNVGIYLVIPAQVDGCNRRRRCLIMSFIPELKAFLKRSGVIYTVRKYKMADAHVEVEGVGRCHRIPLGEVNSKEDLVSYVAFSGFNTLDDWWTKIEWFIPDSKVPKYLYKVLASIAEA